MEFFLLEFLNMYSSFFILKGTALAISKKLAETHFSLNGNGLSEIVIAGWDKKVILIFVTDFFNW